MKTVKLKNLSTGKVNYKRVNNEFPMEVGEKLHTGWDRQGPVYSECISIKPTNSRQ